MRKIATLIICLLGTAVYAQKICTVTGTYTYYAEMDQTPKEAKRRALEGARLQAIADEFGTVITQATHTGISMSNAYEQSYFSQLSDTEVKGEWISDIGEPKYDISFAQGMLIVKCTVEGKARALSNEAADFSALILRNGVEAKFADVNFRPGDDMFLQVTTPIDGYLAVYLVDETPEAFCLLPYLNNATGQQPVKHNTRYVFFSQSEAQHGEVADEYTLTCDHEVEHNTIYVIFSPQPFIKALDTQMDAGLPRQLSYNDFSKWLTSCRRKDPKMGVKVIHIEIKQ